MREASFPTRRRSFATPVLAASIRIRTANQRAFRVPLDRQSTRQASQPAREHCVATVSNIDVSGCAVQVNSRTTRASPIAWPVPLAPVLLQVPVQPVARSVASVSTPILKVPCFSVRPDSRSGFVACLDCPFGQFADTPGATKCQLCTPGKYNSQLQYVKKSRLTPFPGPPPANPVCLASSPSSMPPYSARTARSVDSAPTAPACPVLPVLKASIKVFWGDQAAMSARLVKRVARQPPSSAGRYCFEAVSRVVADTAAPGPSQMTRARPRACDALLAPTASLSAAPHAASSARQRPSRHSKARRAVCCVKLGRLATGWGRRLVTSVSRARPRVCAVKRRAVCDVMVLLSPHSQLLVLLDGMWPVPDNDRARTALWGATATHLAPVSACNATQEPLLPRAALLALPALLERTIPFPDSSCACLVQRVSTATAQLCSPAFLVDLEPTRLNWAPRLVCCGKVGTPRSLMVFAALLARQLLVPEASHAHSVRRADSPRSLVQRNVSSATWANTLKRLDLSPASSVHPGPTIPLWRSLLALRARLAKLPTPLDRPLLAHLVHQVSNCLSCSLTPFAPGTAQENPGSAICTVCPPGKFNALVGQARCTDCDVATFSESPGAQSCSLCTPGFAQNVRGASACVSCRIGTAAAEVASPNCTACPPGRFSLVDAASTCSSCTPGRYQVSDLLVCRLPPLRTLLASLPVEHAFAAKPLAMKSESAPLVSRARSLREMACQPAWSVMLEPTQTCLAPAASVLLVIFLTIARAELVVALCVQRSDL